MQPSGSICALITPFDAADGLDLPALEGLLALHQRSGTQAVVLGGSTGESGALEGAELEVREDALRAIARKAMERKAGARGLRTILEHVLLDTMYDLPSLEDVSKVVIDEAVIKGESAPYIIFGGGVEQRQLAASD